MAAPTARCRGLVPYTHCLGPPTTLIRVPSPRHGTNSLPLEGFVSIFSILDVVLLRGVRSVGAMVVSTDHDRPPRTIVLCFDGTRDQYGSKNTNVVKFFGLLRRDCPEQQVVYYQAGIGTYFAPGVVSPRWNWLASLLDEAVAWYLDAHVMGGYKYLMDNYRYGDKICLFGFSRGAYTARALAGMLAKVGLLPGDNLEQVTFAYKAYVRTDEEGIKLAAGFKQTFSRDVKVEFVGVWDTVQSTGVLVSRVRPFTDSDTAIRIFRHALSLDERRSRFRPNLYHWTAQDSKADSVGSKPAQRNTEGLAPSKLPLRAKDPSPDVLEVWFSGCHSDIGGGNVAGDVGVSLAQITLHWMVEQVIQSQCGILFDDNQLSRIGFKVPSLPPQPSAASGPISPDSDINGPPARAATDASDSTTQGLLNKANQSPVNVESYSEDAAAVAPLFDQLKINKLWWLLEIMPSSYAWQDADGVWHNKWSINLGRGRRISHQQPKFHHTVKERMDYESLKYKPHANYDHDEIYV